MSKQTIPVGNDDSLSISQVGGDLMVQGWDRPELQASGDVIRVEREDRSITVTSGGDLSLSVPRALRVSVGSVGGDATMQDLAGALELGLVGGDANLRNLTGSVQLTSAVGGQTRFENVANVSMSHQSRGPDFDMNDRLQRKIQQATERAERKIRRAQAKLDHYQSLGSHWKYNSGSSASSAAPQGEAVSEEERMTILRMLQEKKITSEEAEKLLSALEGDA